jgi:hypothetical protein
MRFFPPGAAGEVVLWETPLGLRCISVRRDAGPPFEITIAHGDTILCRMSFQLNDDAVAFAIAAMYEGDNLRRLAQSAHFPTTLQAVKPRTTVSAV